MREIKFRGKHIDNGEWVYGGIVHQTDCYGNEVDKYFIIDGTTTQDYDIGFEYQVIPETVGQFTGQLDRTKKEYVKIYENDIVKNTFDNSVYVVMWLNIYGYYALIPIDIYRTEEDIVDYLIDVDLDINNVYQFYNTIEVIGNIHEDNL